MKAFFTIFLSVLYILAPINASAIVSVTENFDSYSAGALTPGNAGTGWSSAWGDYTAGGNDVSTTQFKSSPNSMLGKAALGKRSFSSDTSFDIFFQIFVTAGTTGSIYIGDTAALGAYCRIAFTSGAITITATTITPTYTDGTWQSVEIQGDTTASGRMRAAVNGGSFSSYVTCNGVPASFAAMVVGQEGGTTVYFDDFSNTAPVTSVNSLVKIQAAALRLIGVLRIGR